MIEVNSLSKSFGDVHAVKSVNFSVSPGEIFGLLGPNGAGKTTTIHMMCGLLTPDSGQVLLDGTAFPGDNGNRRAEIGFVPQVTALYPELSAIDNLKFWGGLYGLKGSVLKERIDAVLRIVELSSRGKDKVETYSEGMKKRINMAAGILHDPKVVFMDEPTAGVDPQGRYAILGIVRELAAAGKTIIYTTHYMDEAQKLCDRIGIIDYGDILALGTFDELKEQVGEGLQLYLRGEFTGGKLSRKLKDVTGGEVIHSGTGFLAAVVESPEAVGKFVAALKTDGIAIQDMKVKETDLETVFLKLTGRELRD